MSPLLLRGSGTVTGSPRREPAIVTLFQHSVGNPRNLRLVPQRLRSLDPHGSKATFQRLRISGGARLHANIGLKSDIRRRIRGVFGAEAINFPSSLRLFRLA